MKKFLAIISLVSLAVSAFAEVDLLPRLSSAQVAAATTNSAQVGAPIGWQIDQVACVQVTTTATNAPAAGVYLINWDTSNDGNNWKTAQYSTSALQSGVTIARLTNSVGAQYLRVGTIANTNAAAAGTIVISQFNYVPKQ